MKRFKKPKRRKNPYVDEKYFSLLQNTLITGHIMDFSNLLSYYSVGRGCDDCGKIFNRCTCEGDREWQGLSCRYCDQNYCVCDYDIWDETIFDNEKVQKEVWKLARNSLKDIMKLLSYETYDGDIKFISDVIRERGYNSKFINNIDKLRKKYLIRYTSENIRKFIESVDKLAKNTK